MLVLPFADSQDVIRLVPTGARSKAYLEELTGIEEATNTQDQTWIQLTSKPDRNHKEVLNTKVPFCSQQGALPGKQGSVTSHNLDFFFGPCALRIRTMPLQALQEKIYALNVILHKQQSGDNLDEEDVQNRPKLIDLCMQLGVFSDVPQKVGVTALMTVDWIAKHKDSILEWEGPHSVPLPKKVRDMLGKTWVFLGSDIQDPRQTTDLDQQHAYIRMIGQEWADGKPRLVACMANETTNWLRRIIQEFVFWFPCRGVLHKTRCLTDAAGQSLVLRIVCIVWHT
jgi:hypothetical protein